MKTYIVGLLIYLAVGARRADGRDLSEVELPVYTQHRDISRFLYQENLPELSELTVCFKLNAEDTQSGSPSSLVSIATPGKANDWYLGFNSHSMLLYRDGPRTTLFSVSSGTALDMLVGWHTHCFTWKAGGNISWYSDQTEAGRMDFQATKLVYDIAPIQENGTLIMLQDQDSYFGGLDGAQITAGNIAWINMWDYEMSAEEISGLGCGAQGNVVGETSIQMMGADAIYGQLPCEDLSEVELSVYTQHLDISRFLYQKDLPGLSELTICFKLNAEEIQLGSHLSLVSIATPGKANDWYLAFSSHSMFLYRDSSLTTLVTVSSGTALDMLVGWHTHCFTWKAGGNVSWYSDQTETGRMELQATKLVSGISPIQENGILIMLQDQDSHFGGLDLRQTTAGNITWINMWDYEMSAEGINGLVCGAQGNVVNERSIQMNGIEAMDTQLLCQDQSVTTTTTTPSMTTTTTTPSMTSTTATTTTTPSMTTTTTPSMTTTTTTPSMTTTTTPSMTTATPSKTTTTTSTTESTRPTTTEPTSATTNSVSTTPRFRPRPPSKYNKTPCETSSKFYGICQMNNMECQNGTYTDGLCRRPVNKGQIFSNDHVVYRSCCIEGQTTGYEPRRDNF